MGIKKNVDFELNEEAFREELNMYYTDAGLWFEVKDMHICIPKDVLPSLIGDNIAYLHSFEEYRDELVDVLKNTLVFLEGDDSEDSEKI